MKSRQVSAGFLASQIVGVQSDKIIVDMGAQYPQVFLLRDLNGREIDEVNEYLKSINRCLNCAHLVVMCSDCRHKERNKKHNLNIEKELQNEQGM